MLRRGFHTFLFSKTLSPATFITSHSINKCLGGCNNINIKKVQNNFFKKHFSLTNLFKNIVYLKITQIQSSHTTQSQEIERQCGKKNCRQRNLHIILKFNEGPNISRIIIKHIVFSGRNQLLAGDLHAPLDKIKAYQPHISFKLQRNETENGTSNIKDAITKRLQLQIQLLHQSMYISKAGLSSSRDDWTKY